MPAAIPLRRDFDAPTLRRLARRCRDNRQIRRLLALAAVYDGLNRTEAARIGGMDRQTLRDWVLRFNADEPDGLESTPKRGAITLPFSVLRLISCLDTIAGTFCVECRPACVCGFAT